MEGPAALDAGWVPDWDAMARHIVERSLRIIPGERVVLLQDPLAFPDLVDAVRVAIQRAGGVEVGAMNAWTPSIAEEREGAGYIGNPARRDEERAARLGLFLGADVFIMLPHDEFERGRVSPGETEWILARWRGRSVHFHWAPDPGSLRHADVHQALYRTYERAVLDLDYEAHRRTQERLIAALRGAHVRITSPAGTDLTFDLAADGWYHMNDGDASPEKAARATCARDREEELPCGNVRVIPTPHSVSGVLRPGDRWGSLAAAIDLDPYLADLALMYRGGRLVEIQAGARTDDLRRCWATLSGDADRFSELIFGTHPGLPTPEGARIPAYWGSGAGVLRYHLGANTESGGSFVSNLSAFLFSTDATLVANGTVLIRDGRLDV